MPQPPKFRYAIKSADDSAWYYMNNGSLATSTNPKYFSNDLVGDVISPKEWDKLQVGAARNEKYMGLFTKFSYPMAFTYDAAEIVKKVWAAEGYEGVAIFIIDICDDLAWTYSELYRCELDLSTLHGVEGKEKHVTVNASELSLVSDLKNKEDITQEIDFDNDALTIAHDGIKLKARYRWLAGNINTPVQYQSELNGRVFFPDTSPVSEEENTYLSKLIHHNQQLYHIPPNDNTKYALYTQVDAVGSFDVSFDISYTASAGLSGTSYLTIAIHEIYYYPGGYNLVSHKLYTDSVGITASGTRRVSGTGSVQLSLYANRTYKIVLRVGPTVGQTADLVGVDIYNLDVSFVGTARIPQTDCLAYPYLTFLNKLFKSALGNSVNVLSNYLNTSADLVSSYDNTVKWTCVTSGDALRNASDAKIKTSIREAFQDMRRWGLGLAVENGNIRIEPYSYFFRKDTVLATLTDVPNVEYYPAIDFLCNTINTGYASQTYDSLNGREDFFNTIEWGYPSRRVKKELDWVSPYYASPWAIEYARTLWVERKITTDSQFDNRTYLIDVNGAAPVAGKYLPLRTYNGTNKIIQGLTYPESVYNMGLTPKTTLYFNAPYLVSISYGKPLQLGQNITFQTTEKHRNVLRKLDSVLIDESRITSALELTVDGAGDPVEPLFQPMIFEIETALPENLINILKSDNTDKYGVIRFPYYRNGAFKGNLDMFILDAVFLPATNGVYKLRGLSSPTNNLNIL